MSFNCICTQLAFYLFPLNQFALSFCLKHSQPCRREAVHIHSWTRSVCFHLEAIWFCPEIYSAYHKKMESYEPTLTILLPYPDESWCSRVVCQPLAFLFTLLLSVEQQAVCIPASLLSSQDFWSFFPKCSCLWPDTGSDLASGDIQGLFFHFIAWRNSPDCLRTLSCRTFCTERFCLTGVGVHTLMYPKNTIGPATFLNFSCRRCLEDFTQLSCPEVELSLTGR